MLEAIGKHPESKGLDLRNSLRLIGSVTQDTGQIRDLGNPAPVLLTFELDLESHVAYCSIGLRPQQADQSRAVVARSMNSR